MEKLLSKIGAVGVNINGSGNAIGGNLDSGDDSLTSGVTTIINAVIGILGLVSVVVMIIGGVNYMTSSGDAGKVKKAKDTILYGLIGLIVCALAFALVNWVLGAVLGQA